MYLPKENERPIATNDIEVIASKMNRDFKSLAQALAHKFQEQIQSFFPQVNKVMLAMFEHSTSRDHILDLFGFDPDSDTGNINL